MDRLAIRQTNMMTCLNNYKLRHFCSATSYFTMINKSPKFFNIKVYYYTTMCVLYTSSIYKFFLTTLPKVPIKSNKRDITKTLLSNKILFVLVAYEAKNFFVIQKKIII